ncbi:hypothetical protein LUZ60_000641 [Juncus effusus]|nr:hypothetical protein LUZ60_000641 [Juncus effusus]
MSPIFFLLLCFLNPTTSIHISSILSSYPDLSTFSRLLSSTSIPSELSSRSSLTLLAVPNKFLLRSSSSPSSDISDVLRYHILLDYLSESDLRHLPSHGKLVTTLYQTTGRASSIYGSLNLTSTPFSTVASSPAPFSPSNATVLAQVAAFPYNLSILAVDSLLVPFGFDLAASETSPPSSPAVNITKVLLDAHDFNVAASMLEASGVSTEFEGYEHGVGITVFVPTDLAFASGEENSKFRSLPADKKALILKSHALHSYYPLGSLQSIVNPAQPTVATEDTKAGLYTLNITRINGSVSIGTGLIQASITRTVFDQNPVAVFAVSKVLLPKEIFGPGGAGRVELAGVAPNVAAPPAAGPDSDKRGYIVSAGNHGGFGALGLIWRVGLICLCHSGMIFRGRAVLFFSFFRGGLE